MKSPVIDNLQYVNWSETAFRQLREGGVDAIHVTIAYHESFREAVLNVLAQHGSMFDKETVDPETGETTTEDQSEHIRATLAAAWNAYVAQTEPDEDFRTYVAQSEDHGEAQGGEAVAVHNPANPGERVGEVVWCVFVCVVRTRGGQTQTGLPSSSVMRRAVTVSGR